MLPKNTIQMIKASECPGSHALMDIQLRPLQTETLMILWFISASLWGCPGGGLTSVVTTSWNYFPMTNKNINLSAIFTLTIAQT